MGYPTLSKPRSNIAATAMLLRFYTRQSQQPVIMTNDIAELLREQAAIYNTPDFIESDPVQFPRRFSSLPDIEITALLSATIAWGNRKMICRNCEKILALTGHQPHAYIMEQAYEELPDMNIHRTFFAQNLRNYMRGLHAIYSRHATLNDFASVEGIGRSEMPAWELARLLSNEITAANAGTPDPRCIPGNLDATALKRLNMALRWLVRNDGIVDLGVWTAIKPSQLFIPLDVHVGNTARDLGLTSRRGNDKKTTIEITEAVRPLNPEDPAIFDFALFGVSINNKIPNHNSTEQQYISEIN